MIPDPTQAEDPTQVEQEREADERILEAAMILGPTQAEDPTQTERGSEADVRMREEAMNTEDKETFRQVCRWYRSVLGLWLLLSGNRVMSSITEESEKFRPE